MLITLTQDQLVSIGTYKHGDKCKACESGTMLLEEYERLSKEYFDALYQCNNKKCNNSNLYSGIFRKAQDDSKR